VLYRLAKLLCTVRWHYWRGSQGQRRQVGALLRNTGIADSLPWQRVIYESGGLSTYKIGIGELQKALLITEGVEFDGGAVNLSAFRWFPSETFERPE
jgi:methylated-DNA-protein-cysteine methyltransferase-like protein